MIVLDVNILLYAYDSTSSHHVKARAWIEQTFSGGVLVGLPWNTILAFLRIVTNTRLQGRRFTVEEAIQIVQSWIEQPNVRLLGPGEGHWSMLSQILMAGQVRGPLVPDAEIAALTLECGGVLHTTDRDFARFPGLRWTNPLA
ncbi:MAG: type II toxin-antitoxin system VapC family toxin [Bryobacterales bacterium]|nr:type II toxin-antitoxin system VapC family toxin [Bryobacterales bacterium]